MDNFLVLNRSRAASSRDRLDDLDGEVSEVTSLLKDNVDKVLRRGDKLDDIQQKAGTLFLMISKLFENFHLLKVKVRVGFFQIRICLA